MRLYYNKYAVNLRIKVISICEKCESFTLADQIIYFFHLSWSKSIESIRNCMEGEYGERRDEILDLS